MNHRLGLGYNPAFQSGTLQIPEDYTYLEAGRSFFKNQSCLQTSQSPKSYSLHLSRAPFCENDKTQSLFLDYLQENVPKHAESIGLHLSGPYDSTFSRLGLGAGFEPNTKNETQARKFVEQLVHRLPVPILFENANLYDQTKNQALYTSYFMNELCSEFGTLQIVDLAHTMACALNSGDDPMFLLGSHEIKYVGIVHISGLVKGRDNVWHDGHDQPILEKIWDMLTSFLSILSNDITLVLEHSSPSWSERPEQFHNDAERLRNISQTSTKSTDSCLSEAKLRTIAVGYLANIVLPIHYPKLRNRLGRAGFRELVNAWATNLDTRLLSDSTSFAVRDSSEMPNSIPVLNVIEDFEQFVSNL